MVSFAEAQKLCGTDSEIITQHCQTCLEKRRIRIDYIEYAIINGEIIAEYPDDYPFPSSLIICILLNNSPLHVVCSLGSGFLYFITAYYPSLSKFESDYKTRRAEERLTNHIVDLDSCIIIVRRVPSHVCPKCG